MQSLVSHVDIRARARSILVSVSSWSIHIVDDELRPLLHREAQDGRAPMADGIADGVGLSATWSRLTGLGNE